MKSRSLTVIILILILIILVMQLYQKYAKDSTESYADSPPNFTNYNLTGFPESVWNVEMTNLATPQGLLSYLSCTRYFYSDGTGATRIEWQFDGFDKIIVHDRCYYTYINGELTVFNFLQDCQNILKNKCVGVLNQQSQILTMKTDNFMKQLTGFSEIEYTKSLSTPLPNPLYVGQVKGTEPETINGISTIPYYVLRWYSLFDNHPDFNNYFLPNFIPMKNDAGMGSYYKVNWNPISKSVVQTEILEHFGVLSIVGDTWVIFTQKNAQGLKCLPKFDNNLDTVRLELKPKNLASNIRDYLGTAKLFGKEFRRP